MVFFTCRCGGEVHQKCLSFAILYLYTLPSFEQNLLRPDFKQYVVARLLQWQYVVGIARSS